MASFVVDLWLLLVNRFGDQRMDLAKVNFKRLGYDNFEVWKMRARQFLTREGLWSYVNDDPPATKSRTADWMTKNDLALQTIGYLVEDSQLRIIQDAKTANEAWILLKEYYVKESSVNKVALIKKLSRMELEEGGDMRKHLMELETLFEKLQNVGCILDEDIRGAFMLASLPSSYENAISAIQGRMESFRVNFVKTKLLGEYERQKEKGHQDEQKALAVKAVRRNQNDSEFKRQCFACGSYDHLMRNCEFLRNFRGESSQHRNRDDRRTVQSAKSAAEESGRHICFAAIRDSAKEVWYIDSGASMHMTGDAGNLDVHEKVELQKVVLPDGKILQSNLRGSKSLDTKNGCGSVVRVKLDNVMVVDGLSVNLISVQAITRKGFEVVFNVDGCRIMKNDEVIIAGKKEGQFYRLA